MREKTISRYCPFKEDETMEAMETQRRPGKLGNEAAILEGEKQERPGRTAVRDKQDSKEDKDQTRYISKKIYEVEYKPKNPCILEVF
jgi:hypothetical protein